MAPPQPAPVPPPRARGMPLLTRARHAPTPQAMQRRRFLVGALKWLLPAAALILLSTIALWPEFDRAEDRGRLSFRRSSSTQPDTMRVVEARYDGVDDQQRPYTVTAGVAAQRGTDADIVDLVKPRADISLGDGAWVLAESDEGQFFRRANILDLAGHVTLFHDDGTMMLTEAAHVELRAGLAEGDKPVAAQGPFGTLTSEGFRLTDRGAVVVFTGRAHAVLEGNR